MKIERNIYVNEEKAVSEIQILINKTFLLFSHHELLMSFIMLKTAPLIRGISKQRYNLPTKNAMENSENRTLNNF